LNRNLHILIADPSPIIAEGLESILAKSGLKPMISKAVSLDEIGLLHQKKKVDIILISPVVIQNNLKQYNNLRNRIGNSPWLGLVYAYYDQTVLSLFDAIITISDSPEMIISIINRIVSPSNQKESVLTPEIISEREIEVLKLLASGMANKEIADKLNISINTVITHRKNITQKTGIKTVSGLTIYAVVQKFISLENLSE
jgi:DNA-binding NarL/FixJ family response regulator